MTLDIDLNDYVLGGFFITKYVHWPASNDYPERHILSLSDCVAPVVPSIYIDQLEAQFRETYAAFGITSDIYPALLEWSETCWTQTVAQVGWLKVFCSLNTAQEFVQRFVTKREDVVILGVAIPKDEVDDFIGEERNETDRCGVFDMIVRRESSPVGEALGFEMLAYEYDQFVNTWLCDGFEEPVRQELRIGLNEHSFINSLEEAKRADRYLYDNEDARIHGPWSYWLIIKYPLEGEV